MHEKHVKKEEFSSSIPRTLNINCRRKRVHYNKNITEIKFHETNCKNGNDT